MKFRSVLAVTFISAMALTGCSTQEDDTNPSTNNPTPVIHDGNGTLVAVKSKSVTQTPIGPIETNIGVGVTFFYETGVYTTFLDAGAISVNGTTLDKQSNNSYTTTPSATNPTGVDFSGGVNWSVSGAGSIPGFSHTVANSFPNVDEITSSTTVDRSAGYTLSTSSVSGADSVVFVIGEVSKTMPGNTTSCTFSASELSGLNAGTSIIMIAPYNISGAVYGGKNFFFVNESVESKTATIQ